MKLPQVAAVVVVLFPLSYARAAPPESFLGAPLPAASGAVAEPARAAGAMSTAAEAALSGGASAARFSSVLDGLKPERRAATRGAKEMQVYQAASPAVVLVVTKNSIGSGALISADGLIVTNLHVVDKNQEVGVVFKPAAEGAEIKDADVRVARVVRRDEVADLALIQVSEVPNGVKPLAVGSASDVQVGSDVHAIGHPTGEAWTYTRGIVSQIRKDYAWAADDKIKHTATVVQTQTPINPGNSGGPLLDDDLEIIGINSFIGDGEGINFAVSGDDVKALLARTEDRISVPMDSAKAKTASDNCEDTVLDSQPSKDPKGERFLVDADCDGKGDYVFVLPKDPKEPSLMMLDTDEDGKLDTIIVDKGRDDKPDQAFYDTDGDGKLDMLGYFKDGEDEPYKWERLEG